MTRKKAPKRDWRMTLFLVISLIIVLSMVLTTFLLPATTGQ
jgi:predicted nucleic acid-binding Zn ribbon protein